MDNSNNSKATEGYAIAGLIIGSVALVLFWLPFIGFVPSIIAIILSIIAYIKGQKHYFGQKSIIIIAIIISGIAFLSSGYVTYKTTKFFTENIDEIEEGINNFEEKFDKSIEEIEKDIEESEIEKNTEKSNSDDVIDSEMENSMDEINKKMEELEKDSI